MKIRQKFVKNNEKNNITEYIFTNKANRPIIYIVHIKKLYFI